MKPDVKLNKNSPTFETVNDIIKLICNKCKIKPEVQENENEILYEFPGEWTYEQIVELIDKSGHNRVKQWIIEKPLNEVIFEWFDGNGNQVEYGKHVPWLFQVKGEGIDTIKVIKVELPICDGWGNERNPIVKIYCRDVNEEKNDNY